MTEKEKKELPIIISLIVLLILAVSFFFFRGEKKEEVKPNLVPLPTEVLDEDESEVEDEEEVNPVIVGHSVEKRKIESYSFGEGETKLLFIGGIHGGYEWNSTLLAYQIIDELEMGKIILPENIQVKIIPTLNPDGLFRTTGKEGLFEIGDVKDDSVKNRYNLNKVDLNRNFDCKWEPTSNWRSEIISAGTEPFSEPEALALKNYVEKIKPDAVIFWHSQANTVYASECEKGIIPETIIIMNTYAKAAGYLTEASFDAYPITGDAEGWLASIGIPAITVEMKTHNEVEFSANKKGVEALLKFYEEK